MNNNDMPPISLISLWRMFLQWRKPLIISFFVSSLIGMGVGFLLPKYYKASVTIMAPEVQQGGSLFGGIVGPLASAGFSKGGISTQAILALLKSSSLRGQIIRHFELIDYLHTTDTSSVYKTIEKLTDIKVDADNGMIKISFEFTDPGLAQKIANFYVYYLDTLNAKKKLFSQKPLVKVIDWASKPTKKSRPKIKWIMVLFAFFGTLLTFIILYIKNSYEFSKK